MPDYYLARCNNLLESCHYLELDTQPAQTPGSCCEEMLHHSFTNTSEQKQDLLVLKDYHHSVTLTRRRRSVFKG